jgi:hypothetical protein
VIVPLIRQSRCSTEVASHLVVTGDGVVLELVLLGLSHVILTLL